MKQIDSERVRLRKNNNDDQEKRIKREREIKKERKVEIILRS